MPLTSAVASSVHEQERMLFFVLLQMAVIVAAARLGGLLARKLGQPRVVGEILSGIVLGPTLLGRMFPGASDFLFYSVDATPLQVISQIALLLLMFQIGLDFDFSHLGEDRNQRAVILVSLAGILLPFGLGFWLGQASSGILAPGIDPLGYSLFMASAMSITAVPILGRMMAEFDLHRTRLGAIAITSAAINDVLGWLLLAVVSTMVAAQFSGVGLARQIGLLLLFFVVAWFVVRPLLKRYLRSEKVTADHLPANVMAVVFVLVILAGLCTFKLGIFAIFGGFIMGVLLFDHAGFVEAWKRKVADFVTVFLLPIFSHLPGCAPIFRDSTAHRFGFGAALFLPRRQSASLSAATSPPGGAVCLIPKPRPSGS